MSDDLFDSPLAESTLPDFVKDEAPQEPAPSEPEIQPEVTPEAPEATPAVPLAEAPSAEPEPEAPTEEQVKVWAGKYQNPEELEKGYRELRELQRRTAESRKAAEQRSEEIMARARQLEQTLAKAIPYVRLAGQLQAQQQQRPQAPQDPYSLEQPQAPVAPPQPSVTPDMVAPMVQRGVQDQMRQWQEYQYQEAAVQAEYQAAESNLKAFFERHPEVEPESAVDEDIAAAITALNDAWAPTGTEVDISSAESLDIAYEASKRPALREVLELNPQYIDTEAGMRMARHLASQLDGVTQASPAQGRVTPTPRTDTPVVERGSSQAPSGTPLDEYDQAVAAYHDETKKRGSDILFGG